MFSSYYSYYFGDCYERKKVKVEKNYTYVNCGICNKRIVINLKTEPYKSVCGECFEVSPILQVYYEGKVKPKLHPKYIFYSNPY